MSIFAGGIVSGGCTLVPFLEEERLPEHRKVVHIDSDLYSSTLFVLATLAPWLRVNDILIFDDLGHVREPGAEFRAFEDFCCAYPINLTVLGSANSHTHFAFKLVQEYEPQPRGAPRRSAHRSLD